MSGATSYGGVHTLTLGSGYKVKVRRPSIYHLIAAGSFPAELAGAVYDLAEKGSIGDRKSLMGDPEAFQRFAEAIDKLIPFVLVDPKIGQVDNLTEDDDKSLHGTWEIDTVKDLDRQTIFFFGQGWVQSDEEKAGEKPREVTADTVNGFRPGAARGDAGPGGEAVPAAAVGAGGAPAGGAGGA